MSVNEGSVAEISTTAKRYQALFGKRGGRRKYGNVSTWHDSPVVGLRRYDSKKEAQYAARLDLEVKAGLVIAWWPQVPLFCGFDNDDGSPCRLIVDFRILTPEGVRYVDVKGMAPTKDWEVKRKAVEQRHGILIEVV